MIIQNQILFTNYNKGINNQQFNISKKDNEMDIEKKIIELNQK